ncbi:MAG: folate-binding protein YgfZ [Synechococcales cyanobacterium RU_4_20]|nr:folate-binding protein YgfZ [Synechococcales cyanobacterium RU_4_20]NJR71084.1 folate-binding protein YgfZ [Synechococcales cyanobacterium CRU_2_2]
MAADGVLSFGNDATAIAAARSGVALADRTHWDRIWVRDGDRLKFLHNQTTNDFRQLSPGQGCETVFVTATARTLDLASAYVLDDAVLLQVSPGQGEALMKFCDRYIFFDDTVKLALATETLACFTLIGPDSHRLIEQLTGKNLSTQLAYSHQVRLCAGIEVRIASGSDLALPGYNLFCEAESAAALWQVILDASLDKTVGPVGPVVAMGAIAWEQLRIQQGRPAVGQELTEDYNPLEAGLWQTISFDKGCYIGQETIARLNTYNGVKQRLFGLQLDGPAKPGSMLKAGEEKVGKITSVVETPDGVMALAYLRTKIGGEGLIVSVGEASDRLPRGCTGTAVPLAYVKHPT